MPQKQADGTVGWMLPLDPAVRANPHDVVMGYYSVHTNASALERGEAEIRRIGDRLRASGRPRQPSSF